MSKGVGIYIGSNEVIAVSVIRSPSGPKIKRFAVESISAVEVPEPSSEQETHKPRRTTPQARAIYRVLEKIGETGAYVTAAVSSTYVATRQFVMPSVPLKDEQGAIEHEASRYMPFKLADSVLDYSAHMTHKKVLSVTATAIRKEVLEECVQELHAASAKVLMVEPVYSAVSRGFSALRMVGKGKVQGFVVLQSDGNVNVTLAMQGNVYLSRDFMLSGNFEEDKPHFFEELSASIDYFYKLTGGESVGQLFLSGHGDLKGWVEVLERDFQYKIRFDMARFPEKDKLASEDAAVMLVAFGLALRDLNYRSPLGDVKLLPPDDRRSGPVKLLAYLAGQSALIFLFFLLVRLVFFQPFLAGINHPYEKLLKDIVLEDPAFESRSSVSLEEKEKLLSGKTHQLYGFLRGPLSASELLSEIGRGLPQAISLDAIEVEVSKEKESDKRPGAARSSNRFTMRGLCSFGSSEKETAILSVWVKALAQKKTIAAHFPDIKLAEIKREKVGNQDMTRFLIVNE